MDLNQYNKLSADHRLEVWTQLKASNGWQVLKEIFLSQISSAPRIVDQDSREAFLYAAIENQVKAGLMNFPEEQIRNIERAQRK